MPISTEVTILSGMVIGGASAIFGKFMGGKDKVERDTCEERRNTLNLLVSGQMKDISRQLNEQTKKLEKLEEIIIASLTK